MNFFQKIFEILKQLLHILSVVLSMFKVVHPIVVHFLT